MKKTLFVIGLGITFFAFFYLFEFSIFSESSHFTTKVSGDTLHITQYTYPQFYRGIYLTVASGRDYPKLKQFIEEAKTSGINTIVIDAQIGTRDYCAVPAENVALCLANGLHPIARIVVFADGLKQWPVHESVIENRLKVAEDACRKGFKEIQFDYIRFTDYTVQGKVSLAARYAFIEGFLAKARDRLKSFNVKIAADVFGRIPLNTNDAIGQRMEGLDNVVDIICPMAYPSHYTWSKKLQSDPYYTVFLTSRKAKERTKKAEIVSYIQAFQMKVGMSGLTFDKYIEAQIKAVHDAKIRGFILWNARNDYRVPLATVRSYYLESGRISKTESSADDDSL